MQEDPMATYADLTGRVALVTGGAGALGRGTTRALLDAGATVVITDSHDRGMHEQVASLPEGMREHCTSVQADITTEEGAQRAVRHAIDAHGGLDILVNIVGGYAGGPTVAETEFATWRGQFELNATTAFLMARAAVPAMQARGRGRIINVSSRVARTAPAGLGAYAVSKAAVITLTEVLANETRAFGITANAILPSVIDTPANRQSMPDATFDDWVKPEAIGAVIRFLASEESGIISGAAIPVYGRA
jgi:NAD(P)-dependent dehydrogenase (short-subunit alcohol dehydrogenase family)